MTSNSNAKLYIKVGFASSIVALLLGMDGLGGNTNSAFFARVFIIFWVILFAHHIGSQKKE